MSEPRTEAGRAAAAILEEADIHWPDALTVVSPDVFRVAVAKAEAEARADLARRIEARVETMDFAKTVTVLGPDRLHDAVLDAIRAEAER